VIEDRTRRDRLILQVEIARQGASLESMERCSTLGLRAGVAWDFDRRAEKARSRRGGALPELDDSRLASPSILPPFHDSHMSAFAKTDSAPIPDTATMRATPFARTIDGVRFT